MGQKETEEKFKEIKSKAYELYQKHGLHNGNDFVDWLEAEKLTGAEAKEKQAAVLARLQRKKQMQSILVGVTGILGVVVVILLMMLFRARPNMELYKNSLSELKVLVLDQKADEQVVVFGDTHFDYDKSTLTAEAKALLDKEVQVLKENPKMNVRMAGYTSAKGSEDDNQKLSEKRANAVRDCLIEKGVSPERITTVGYGRTKPALYEVSPGDINTKEAKANMRVLFEVVVK